MEITPEMLKGWLEVEVSQFGTKTIFHHFSREIEELTGCISVTEIIFRNPVPTTGTGTENPSPEKEK